MMIDRCSVIGCNDETTKRCGFPVNHPYGGPHPCDAPLCDRHATTAGPDLDYCPPHARYVMDHGGE